MHLYPLQRLHEYCADSMDWTSWLRSRACCRAFGSTTSLNHCHGIRLFQQRRFVRLHEYCADSMDWLSWLRSRACCRAFGSTTTLNHCHGIRLFEQRKFVPLLQQAASYAMEEISSQPWDETNPRCCSERCKHSRRTGVYVPRHTPIVGLTPEEITATQNLWWKNYERTPSWGTADWARADPQMRVSEWMRRYAYGLSGREVDTAPKDFYVVCCAECYQRVRKKLEILSQYKQQYFEVVIGVEKLVLERDKSRRPLSVFFECAFLEICIGQRIRCTDVL